MTLRLMCESTEFARGGSFNGLLMNHITQDACTNADGSYDQENCDLDTYMSYPPNYQCDEWKSDPKDVIIMSAIRDRKVAYLGLGAYGFVPSEYAPRQFMDWIGCDWDAKEQVPTISFFCKLKNLKKHESHFLQA